MGDFVGIETGDGGTFEAYSAGPSRAPGIIILQEIFGVTAHMRAVADGFASAGYRALVPDLFWRQRRRIELDAADPADREEAKILMAGLDTDLALLDAAAAMRWLCRDNEGSSVSAIGFCLGGKLAFLLATRVELAAAAIYYGTGLHDVVDQIGDVRCPLLVHVGGDDPLCPPAGREKIAAALAERPATWLTLHGGAGHAFARPGPTHVPHAAELARVQTGTFLQLALS